MTQKILVMFQCFEINNIPEGYFREINQLMWNTMSCTRDRKVIFGITIFCLAISLSKNASIDTITKNDDANEKIKKLLKEDDDGVVVQTTTVYPAQEIKKVPTTTVLSNYLRVFHEFFILLFI